MQARPRILTQLDIEEIKMEINHSFDMSPEVGASVEVLASDTYFLAVADKEAGFDCAGTVGSAGSVGGTLGTFGTFGCCC